MRSALILPSIFLLILGPIILTGSVTAGSTTFDTGLLERGDEASVVFEDIGVWNYICGPHPFMEGLIVVEEGVPEVEVTVNIEDFSFQPAEITVGPGSEIHWINKDSDAHSAVGAINGTEIPATQGHHSGMGAMMGGWSWIILISTLMLILILSLTARPGRP